MPWFSRDDDNEKDAKDSGYTEVTISTTSRDGNDRETTVLVPNDKVDEALESPGARRGGKD